MANNTIRLAFAGLPGPEIEGILSGADAVPGKLMIEQGDGTYALNQTKPGTAKIVLVESLMGNNTEIDNPIDVVKVAGDRLTMVEARPGDVMLMWLNSPFTAAIGAPLGADSIGNLIVLDFSPALAATVIGIALEAVTTGASAERIKVQIA